MKTLWLYHNPTFSIKRKGGVIEEDPEEQSRVLCAIMMSTMPSGVVRKFCEMTGADHELVFDIGNEFIKSHGLSRGNGNKPKLNREIASTLSEEALRTINTSFFSHKELAQMFDIDTKTVQYIRQSKRSRK